MRYLFSTAFLIAISTVASAQTDTLKFRDPEDGGEKTLTGEVKETPAGIVIAHAGKTTTVSPADVIALYYSKLAGVDDRTRMEMPDWDAKGGPEALANYSNVLKAVTRGSTDDRTKRFLEFKMTMLAARIAESKSGNDFKTDAAAAVNGLTTFARGYSKSWEVWPAARTAARLQADLGKFSDAATTLANLAKAEGISRELQNEARLAEVDMLLRGGSALTLAPSVDALATLTALTDSQKQKLAVYRAILPGVQDRTDPAKVEEAAKAVRALIDKMADPAAAHNALGELYILANLPQKAKREFLWVEAVHNQDREEVLRALTRLCDVFDKLNDKEHAGQYRDKLLKLKTS
jgi:hypothetical protein